MGLEPDEETARLYRAIQQRAPQAARSGVPGDAPAGKQPGGTLPALSEPSPRESLPARQAASLPHPLNALLGRETERRGIAEAVRKQRLVTLVGGGGLGKTRLAIQVAHDLAACRRERVQGFLALLSER
jgi:hypothetical protein